MGVPTTNTNKEVGRSLLSHQGRQLITLPAYYLPNDEVSIVWTFSRFSTNESQVEQERLGQCASDIAAQS
jgi:hypothetical protein